MRTKRSARGRFHRSSHWSDSATAARPLPPPITDNISYGNDRGAARMEVQNSTESDDNLSGFSGDEMTNGFDEKTCLECNRGEHLLFCSGIGCPIALHEKCTLGQPKYDDGGRFYCPYCWYKLQRARTEELRNKVMLAKKDVNSFINFRPEVACGDEDKQNNKRAKGKDLNVRKIIGEASQCEHVKSVDVDDEVQNVARERKEDHQHNNNVKLPCNDQNGEVAECEEISVTHAHGIVEDEVEQGKNDQLDDDEKDEGTDAAEECAEASAAQCVAENTVVNGSFHGSPGAKSGTSNRSERDRVFMKKEEQLNKGAPRANVSCTAEDGTLNGLEVPDSETENYVARPRHVKQRKSQKADLPKTSTVHSHTSSPKATRKPVEGVASLKNSKQSEMPAKKFIDPPFAHEKRKRMLWKPEEEEMFRNGVRELEGDHQHNSQVKRPCCNQCGEVAECEKKSATHAHRVVEDEVGMEQEKNDPLDDDEKDEGANADEEHAEISTAQCAAERIVVDGDFHGSPGAKSEAANKSERDQVSMEKEEQLNKDATAKVSCATEVPDSETEGLVKRRNSQKADSPKKSKVHSHTSSTKATRKPVEEVAPLKKPNQPEMPANKIVDLPFAHEKRKRILWKPEEEEMLKEGVHKFSSAVNKNLPWKKILEFGRHVFDPSRNPADLKDKWRKLKES